ncbi:hypothetical protein XH84_22260 [Bradyrhizobium nanningense]|nr:hypothetical protein XH84_22260 [Bradyrhizobium nanningense]
MRRSSDLPIATKISPLLLHTIDQTCTVFFEVDFRAEFAESYRELGQKVSRLLFASECNPYARGEMITKIQR